MATDPWSARAEPASRDSARCAAARRAGRAAWLCLALGLSTAIAQDTPELLAAMRAAMPPVPEQVPDLDALPPDLRRQLPALRIEVHRWHADPAQRFVRLGGRRVMEGGVAGQELWLREIRRDGVVMQFRNAFFVLPVTVGD